MDAFASLVVYSIIMTQKSVTLPTKKLNTTEFHAWNKATVDSAGIAVFPLNVKIDFALKAFLSSSIKKIVGFWPPIQGDTISYSK